MLQELLNNVQWLLHWGKRKHFTDHLQEMESDPSSNALVHISPEILDDETNGTVLKHQRNGVAIRLCIHS